MTGGFIRFKMAKEDTGQRRLCVKNHQLGRLGAFAAGAATLLFALAMLIPDKTLSMPLASGISIFISFGYLLMACGLAALAQQDRKGCALAAVAFAAAYAALICLVYYTQLTTVRQQAASMELLDALTYKPGTWMFNVDMLGYGLLSISTFFAGFAVTARTNGEAWLRRLLLVHGVFALACLLFPVLGVFAKDAGGASSDLFGVLVLEFWCVYFLPVTMLFARYMKRQGL